jgi:hypothetical protein
MENLNCADIINQIAEVSGLTSANSRRLVEEFEITFARPYAAKLKAIKLKEIISHKNAYLYRASGINTCHEIVRRAMEDYVSASVEGYFGSFFESVARITSSGVKPVGGGEVDLDIRRGDVAYLYAIKSGAKGFNSSSYDKARRDLESAERRLRQDRIRVEKKIAFAYGRKRTTFKDGIERLASKSFWEEVSGDAEFYKKLLDICAFLAPLYTADMAAPYDNLLEEAHHLFCEEDHLNWDIVLRLVSG